MPLFLFNRPGFCREDKFTRKGEHVPLPSRLGRQDVADSFSHGCGLAQAAIEVSKSSDAFLCDAGIRALPPLRFDHVPARCLPVKNEKHRVYSNVLSLKNFSNLLQPACCSFTVL